MPVNLSRSGWECSNSCWVWGGSTEERVNMSIFVIAGLIGNLVCVDLIEMMVRTKEVSGLDKA